MKYRKKPVVIEAEHLDGTKEGLAAVMRLTGGLTLRGGIQILSDAVIIPTLEGDMRADVGDWVIQGIKGEFYPCKPDIFAATYELVVDPS